MVIIMVVIMIIVVIIIMIVVLFFLFEEAETLTFSETRDFEITGITGQHFQLNDELASIEADAARGGLAIIHGSQTAIEAAFNPALGPLFRDTSVDHIDHTANSATTITNHGKEARQCNAAISLGLSDASRSSVAIASSTTVAVAAHPIDDDVDFATGYFSLLVVSIP